jgi:integrase
MGKHQGFQVIPDGDRWRGRYRVGGTYRSKTYDTAEQARAWAMARASELITGQPVGVTLPVVTPRADAAKLAALYLVALDTRRRAISHQANVKHTLAMVADAVPDLAAPEAHRQMEAWLDGVQILRVGRHQRKRSKAPSPGYRNRLIAEVRAWCRWLVRKEYLTLDPSRTLDRATVHREIKAQFTMDEVRQLCAPCADHPLQRWVCLMLLAGLRADEACALTWADVVGLQIYVRKHAGHRLKRGKERLVPLQGRLAEILGPPGAGTVAPLPGARSTVQMGRHFRTFLRHCGIEPGDRTPHSCRHTYGAMMIATGAPSILVQAYMGHKAMATTSDYAQAAPLHVEAVKGWGMGVLLPDRS